jgi:lysophospholipase L1-like esterase
MRREGQISFAVAGLLAVCVGCGGSGSTPSAGSQAPSTGTPRQSVNVVAIGDSDTTGIGDPTAHGWVGRYVDLLHAKLGTAVRSQNLALEGQTSDELLEAVTHDPKVRETLAGADIILIGIGGADLNAGDDALGAGRCKGRQCYAPVLRRFTTNISAIASEVRHLAPHALLRAMTLPNGFPGAGAAFPPFATESLSRYQAESQRRSVCRAMHANAGRCIDVIAAFNGAHDDRNAYASGLMTKNPCCYPSAKGQQLIARLMIATGLAKLPQAQSS